MNTNLLMIGLLLVVGVLYLLRRRSRMNKED
jgi:LPXTG-motif cell wall-anchored protein